MRKRIKVAVSGVGGGVGQSIIKALYARDIEIIGLDSEHLATGLYAVKKGFIIPYAQDPKFLENVLSICEKENCTFYFPGLDAELPILSRNRKQFNNIGTTIVVSEPEVIDICDDKLLTYIFLSKNNILTPSTYTLNDFLNRKNAIDFPLVVKPRKGGARSKNVFLLKRKLDLDRLVDKNFEVDNFLAQEYIEDSEYTCGTINFSGKHFGTIIMKRILRDGDTYKCFSEKNAQIEKNIAKIMHLLKPFGSCNVQLRVKNGSVYIIELNARCSGTTAARAIAGFNEPRMTIDYLLYGKIPKFTIKYISIFRYWKEYVVENRKIGQMENSGFVVSKKITRL